MHDPTTTKQAQWYVAVGVAVGVITVAPIGIGYVINNTSVLVMGIVAGLFGWMFAARGLMVLITPKHIRLRRYYVGFVFRASIIEMSAMQFVLALAIVLLELLSSGERSAISVVSFAALVWVVTFLFMYIVAVHYGTTVVKQIENEGVLQRLGVPYAKLVGGKGSTGGGIVVVGARPGEHEWPYQDQTHSQLLHDMRAAANISSKALYFTHIVKYRTPGDRDPTPEEIRQFWPYMLIELKNIEPKIIITTGQRSLECFAPGANLALQHGKLLTVEHGGMKLDIVPLYHPTDVIADATLRRAFIDDFVAAVKRARAD